METGIGRLQQALANLTQMFLYKQKIDKEQEQQETVKTLKLAEMHMNVFQNKSLPKEMRLQSYNALSEIGGKIGLNWKPMKTWGESFDDLATKSNKLFQQLKEGKLDQDTFTQGLAGLYTEATTPEEMKALELIGKRGEEKFKEQKGLEGIKSLTQGQPIGEQTITAPGATPEPSAFGVQGIQAPPISMEKTTYGKAPISDPLVARLLELSVSDSLPKESWDIIKTQLTPTQIDSYEKGIMAEVQAGRMTLDQAREKLGKGEKQYAPQLKKFVKGKQVRDVDMNKPEDVAKARAEGFTEYERPSERESIGEVSAKTIARKKAQVKVAEEVLGRELTEDEKKKIVIGGGLESLLEQFLHGFGSQPSGVIYDPKSKQMIPAK